MTTWRVDCRINDKAGVPVRLIHTLTVEIGFCFELSFVLPCDFKDEYNAVENVGRRLEVKYK